MTAPTTTPSEAGFYRALERLHGHRCPMSILGARLGFAARQALDDAAGARLAARFLHRTCALDGIQLATGCTPGNRNLQVEPEGRHRLTLWAEGTSRAVTVELTEAALERGRRYAALRQEAADEAPGSPGSAALQERQERLLEELETAPTAELVTRLPAEEAPPP